MLMNEDVVHDTYYVGDSPVALLDFVNAFSREITGKDVRVIHHSIFRAAALVGDVLKSIKVSFPMNSTRYSNMVYPNPAPMKKTFAAVEKEYRFDLETVRRTVEWFNDYRERRTQ